ncbi:Importin subunit alpha-1 [Zancudomyces culisetae]|uniref:Importin subunit alpha n=1 Tax=Zancudomyces culisetae TaxID=1213189 RepID=A0A1R1PLF0_ZANCU|nr:Importin subunit alpha-1 [Zancudomyces culisetae]OMH81785.1 Importin subunit alpha-1 [Zancudomyces culisetae]|eukprot:OMH79647.1 Importin subunit alpha-1 [Zancudomyces culisetae]
MDQKIPEHRRNAYKSKGIFTQDELRRRREEQSVELRKQKRDENLSKRRNFNFEIDNSDSEDEMQHPETEFDLEQMKAQLYSDSAEEQLTSVTKFRKLLSKEKNPPIEKVIECGVVSRFVELLRSQQTVIQFEASWALTNISSGSSTQTQVVIDAQAVPIFVELLDSSNQDVREQAVWALGNIAGDSPQCRDVVLAAGAMEPLLRVLSENHKLSMLRNATWSLSNFCRGKNPQPPWELVYPALPVLSKLIYSVDEEILTDACWAISYLSDGQNEKIGAVIQAGVVPRLVELLSHQLSSVVTPALRSIGNIVTGDDSQTQVPINCGVLPVLLGLLSSPREAIRRETCWTISNITAGVPEQIQAVIEANLIPAILEILQNGDFRSKKEACWAISNATVGGMAQPEQVRYLVSVGCIKPLCDILSCMDNRAILVALDGLENILKVGELDMNQRNLEINHYALMIEEVGGMEKIHNLQMHDNIDIYKKSYQIIDKYFGDENDTNPIDEPEIDPMTGEYTFHTDVSAPQGGFNF